MSQYCLAGVDGETVDTLAACKLQRHQHSVEDLTSATELSDEHCDTAGPGSRPRTVGRPLIYRGDVNDPSLTEGERRKLRRRKANRQSARRVRDRRTQMAGSLEAEVGHVSSNNQAMLHRIRQMEAERGNNRKAVAEFQDQLTALNSLNLRLHGRVACLKHAMKQRNRQMPFSGSAASGGPPISSACASRQLHVTSQALSSAGSSGSGLLHGHNVQHDSTNALLPNKGSEQSAGRPSPAAQWQLGQQSSLLSSSTPLQTPFAPIPVGQQDIPHKLHPSIPSAASLSSTRIIDSPKLAHSNASQVPASVSQHAQAATREPECLDRNLNSLDVLLDSWMQPHAGSSQPCHGGF